MASTGMTWPYLSETAERFVSGPFVRPRSLFDAFVAKGVGSGRRAGPRDLLWQTVAVSSLAALEAGLEELLLGAHAARRGCEGDLAETGVNSPDSNPRAWLADDRLMAPNARKIERILFADFGVVLNGLPVSSQFHARRKNWSKGGSGRGSLVAGPTDWTGLKRYLETLSHIRNAAAHGDTAKLGKAPSHCEGDLWLLKEDGRWSVQQPHALTALRTVLSAFNLAATELSAVTASPPPELTRPDSVDYP